MHGKFARGGRGVKTIRVMLCFRGLRGCWVGGKGGRGGGLEIEAETPAKFSQDSLM